MSIQCQNCGHERTAHQIGLPENKDPKIILPGYKMSLSVCIMESGFNPDQREVRRVEIRKLQHLRH